MNRYLAVDTTDRYFLDLAAWPNDHQLIYEILPQTKGDNIFGLR
jgi:hypothetical protein